MIFSDRIAHEHGVESGHLVDAHARHANHLGHVVHGADGQPAAILTLGQIKQRNHLQEIATESIVSSKQVHCFDSFLSIFGYITQVGQLTENSPFDF
jgi:hypothetical protein